MHFQRGSILTSGAFWLTVLILVLFVAIFLYFRDAFITRVQDTNNTATTRSTPTPSFTPTSSPSATPTANSATGTPLSLADSTVPQSGPADSLLVVSGVVGGGGSILYYYSLKRRLKQQYRQLDVL